MNKQIVVKPLEICKWRFCSPVKQCLEQPTVQGLTKGQTLGKVTVCQHDFAQLLLTSHLTFSIKEHVQVNYHAQCTNVLPLVQNLNETLG